MKRTTKVYSLVPSVRTKGDTAAPISVLPAIPVVFPEHDNVKTLGIIDTSSAVSCISESLLASSTRLRTAERFVAINLAGGAIHVPMISSDLIIADANFAPWLRFHQMEFAVLPKSHWVSDAASVILGYSGCLEHLAVLFDFPKRVVSISAPKSFDLKHGKQDEPSQFNRLREAEILVKIGAFDSAIVMASAAVEEVVRSTRTPQEPFRRFPLFVLRDQLPAELQPALESVMKLRNEAVHGMPEKAFTREVAESTIHAAWKIVRHLSQRSSLEIRHAPSQHRTKDERDAKREARETRIRENIEKNQQRLEKAELALEKSITQAEKLRDKIDSATSESFKERAMAWLEEELERSARIREHIKRINGWIEEDKQKLSTLSLP